MGHEQHEFINQITLFLCGMQIDLQFFSETPVNLSKSELSLSFFLKLMSFDQNLNRGGYFTWGRVPVPSLTLIPPSGPRTKVPKAKTRERLQKKVIFPGKS